jgi:predicted acetyltransferase
MDHEVKVATPEKLGDVLSAVESVFGEELSEGEVERYRRTVDIDRVIYIEDDGAVVAGAGAYTFRSTVPGGVLPTGGVTLVAVKPTHRRRGLLRAMMRQQLDDIRQRGEPIATLWASEGAIYGRFGYGLASVQGWVDVEQDKIGFVDDRGPSGRVVMPPLDQAKELVAPIYSRVQQRTPGMFERSDAWWKWRLLHDPKEWRDGASPKYIAVWQNPSGEARGYAIYRIETGWMYAGPSGAVQAHELIADDVEALREMWRFLLSVDLVSRVKSRSAMLSLDSPLWMLLDEPRRLQTMLTDALWLRVVDVRAALEGRGYTSDGEFTFELRDDFCDWNAGAWRLVVKDGRGEVEKLSGGADADLSLSASTLGSLYLGTFTFTQMERAGLVTGSTEVADALFRSDIAPYCPEIF